MVPTVVPEVPPVTADVPRPPGALREIDTASTRPRGLGIKGPGKHEQARPGAVEGKGGTRLSLLLDQGTKKDPGFGRPGEPISMPAAGACAKKRAGRQLRGRSRGQPIRETNSTTWASAIASLGARSRREPFRERRHALVLRILDGDWPSLDLKRGAWACAWVRLMCGVLWC